MHRITVRLLRPLRRKFGWRSVGPWLFFAGLCTVALTARCEAGSNSSPSAGQPAEGSWELLAPLVVERLDNGMTFLLYPNKRAPILSSVIRFDVGGKDESPGQTGIAHMFEHMAFKGTRRLGTIDWEAERALLDEVEAAATAYDRERERQLAAKIPDDDPAAADELKALKQALEQAKAEAAKFVVKDEFDEIYSREGGADLNASTSSDATAYYISLPANRIELWARMESERLRSPVMREFYSERDVVMEERRMRRDNSPIGRLWELTMATAFVAHSYRYPVIGWEADIRNLKADQAYAFFNAHYTPDRAVGVLVGDIDVETTRRLLRETFGQIPAADRAAPTARTIVPEPVQQGQRRTILRLDATPMLLMAWHKPNAPDAADVAAEVLMEVLAGGRSSRWFEKFVKQDRLASDIYTFTGPGDHQPNLFTIYATPQGETSIEDLEGALRREVVRLATEPIGEQELEPAKKRLRANAIRALETNMGLARQLAESTLLSGDPYYLERRLRQLEAVTPAELMDFAKEFLVDTNLTIGALLPPEEKAEEQASPVQEAQG